MRDCLLPVREYKKYKMCGVSKAKRKIQGKKERTNAQEIKYKYLRNQNIMMKSMLYSVSIDQKEKEKIAKKKASQKKKSKCHLYKRLRNSFNSVGDRRATS